MCAERFTEGLGTESALDKESSCSETSIDLPAHPQALAVQGRLAPPAKDRGESLGMGDGSLAPSQRTPPGDWP